MTKMFNIGDKVVYPLHGAGRIEAIEEKAILDEKQSYYIIKCQAKLKLWFQLIKLKKLG